MVNISAMNNPNLPPAATNSLAPTNPTNNGNGLSTQLTQEERDLIKYLSAQCKELKEKDPKNFDSKRYLQQQLIQKCGQRRTTEIMAYVVQMHKMTRTRQPEPNRNPQVPVQSVPSASNQSSFIPRHQLPGQLPQGPPYLAQLPTLQPAVPRSVSSATPIYPNRPAGQPQQLQHQHQSYIPQNPQPRPPIGINQNENVQKRPDVPHSGRVDHGLDVPPTLEELGADTSTLTSTLMQVNVLSDREIKAESDASDIHLRQSVKSDILIPAVGVRPGITVDMTQPTCYNNVLDENAISQAFQQVIRPSSQQQPPSQISLSPDAASVLSQGIQFHLTYLIDAAIIHSRKRTNRTATEHFTKSQQLIAKDLPNSAPGEVAPENRGNLGMLWGPPRLEELEEFMMKTNDQYHQMKSQVTNIIKQELTADDERRQQKKKGQGTTSEHLNWWNQDDKARDSGVASLEDIAVMRLRQEVAKKYELGPHYNPRKKQKKDDDMEEENSISETFIPSFKPNPQIVYENTPLTKATIRPERCPLYHDKAYLSTVTKADVIAAISKSRGNDLASTKATYEFGTALRVAKTISKR